VQLSARSLGRSDDARGVPSWIADQGAIARSRKLLIVLFLLSLFADRADPRPIAGSMRGCGAHGWPAPVYVLAMGYGSAAIGVGKTPPDRLTALGLTGGPRPGP